MPEERLSLLLLLLLQLLLQLGLLLLLQLQLPQQDPPVLQQRVGSDPALQTKRQ